MLKVSKKIRKLVLLFKLSTVKFLYIAVANIKEDKKIRQIEPKSFQNGSKW
jgi:hypothetical protein